MMANSYHIYKLQMIDFILHILKKISNKYEELQADQASSLIVKTMSSSFPY